MIQGSCLCGDVQYEYEGGFNLPPWAAMDDNWPRYDKLEPKRD